MFGKSKEITQPTFSSYVLHVKQLQTLTWKIYSRAKRQKRPYTHPPLSTSFTWTPDNDIHKKIRGKHVTEKKTKKKKAQKANRGLRQTERIELLGAKVELKKITKVGLKTTSHRPFRTAVNQRPRACFLGLGCTWTREGAHCTWWRAIQRKRWECTPFCSLLGATSAPWAGSPYSAFCWLCYRYCLRRHRCGVFRFCPPPLAVTSDNVRGILGFLGKGWKRKVQKKVIYTDFWNERTDCMQLKGLVFRCVWLKVIFTLFWSNK